MWEKRSLQGECLLLFAGAPILLALFPPRGLIYALLLVAAGVIYYTLRRSTEFEHEKEWNARAITPPHLKPILLRYLVCAAALAALTWVLIPERFLAFPLQRPERWAMVMVLYPIVSVLPQELIFRTFFFHRYARLFAHPWQAIAVNALAFGWMHVLLRNPVAVVFAALGGLMFAHTYLKHRSLALAWLEHALYGCTIFTLGLGWYFYHGNVVR